jgi:CBS domain-containing protein
MTTNDPRPTPAPPETIDDDPFVGSLMSTPLVAIVPSAPLSVALQLMADRQVRHLPVSEEGRCDTVVVEVDLLHGLAAEGGPLGVSPLCVRDVSRLIASVPTRARLSEAARRMRVSGVDAVLVADGARLVGIITATDLVKAVARHSTGAVG